MEHIAFKATLVQSEFAGEHYRDLFDQEKGTFNSPLYDDVEEIFNSIINNYNFLSEFQIETLSRIMESLNEIRSIIDPSRLKNFHHGFTLDGDLLLFRENDKGLINIIIHQDEDFAFSFIGNLEGRRLDFYEPANADFEKIVLDFMS